MAGQNVAERNLNKRRVHSELNLPFPIACAVRNEETSELALEISYDQAQ